VPRVALSTHLLGLMQGMFLLLAGLIWTRLRLTPAQARVALWLLLYGCFAAWFMNLLAAAWGVGGSLLPIAAGQARGSATAETIVTVVLRTAGAALIAAVALVAWGLRTAAGQSRSGAAGAV
jgi:hydroxylaminobenzene mutase